MAKSITVILPLPAKSLSPNVRAHWQTVRKDKKNARYWAGLAAQNSFNQAGVSEPFDKATTQARFFFKDKRRRDGDNFAASLKAYWDGIADAGVVDNDSDMTHLPPQFDSDKDNPRVELTIWETVSEQ